MAMLLNDGRHPETNATIIPEHILAHVARGLTVQEGKASHPELVSFTAPVYVNIALPRNLEPQSIRVWSAEVYLPRTRDHRARRE